MTDRLSGKHALVTAAAQGIGRATALAFRAEGARVLAVDVNEAKLEELEHESGMDLRCLDVTDAAAVTDLAAELGAVDVLCNCVGIVHHGSILECDDSDWDRSFDVNVKSMYRMTRAFLPGMLSRGGGSIINIASVASSIRGLPKRCAYGASKAAVLGLTKSVAADYIRQGVRCNAICPGTVQSPSLDGRIAAFEDPEQARKDFIARQPLGRLGTPEEVAAVAVYLASDESAFTTGTAIVVDGGVTL